MIGQTIDERYHIETVLGRGGMGAVYRATDLAESRLVALKFLDHYLDTKTEAALTRFHREFRVLARLDHSHIMRAFEYGSYNDVPYLVLEFLDGRTLLDELAGGALPRSRILDIARQVGEALVYLHAQSIVHRDLKPGNLMLLSSAETLQVKLMDFGLVRQVDLSMQLTQEGVALGTVAYMAPEQAQGIPVDFRADLYALGVILYEMTAGRTPFVHENPVAMLMQQLTSAPPSPRQFNPELDEPLEQLIMELLAKEPAERTASTALLVQRLAQLADERVPTLSSSTEAVLDTGRADLIPHIPLIGRESALSDLLEDWRRVQAGQGQTILLSGVAGVGKTRLLNEVGLQVRMGQGHFLSSFCREHTSLPYQPIIDVLHHLLRDLPAFEREALPVELVRLLPDASDDVLSEPAPTDQSEARLRLFKAFWNVLQQASQRQTLMVAIEDMQWADPTTLELIGYLAQRTKQAPMLLVLTYRPEELEANSPLTTLLRDLGRSGVADTITVKPLDRDQTAGFLQAALGQEKIPDWIVDNFQQATDGNPLFIEETLKALAAEGQVAEWMRQESNQSRHMISLSGLSLQLPQNVLDLAERRLQLLAAEERSILTTAAVLGPEFSFALLEAVTRLDEDDLLDAIDRLLAARLIEELPLQDGEDRYSFAQEALRQALLNTISQRRLRVLHRRTGEAIQSLYDTSRQRYWPLLAHHFAMAGDDQNALKYFRLAGDAAARVYANAETIAYYSRALDLAKQDEADENVDVLTEIYSRLGRALELSAQFEQALAHYEEMEASAQARNDRPMELAALMAQVTLYPILNPNLDLEQGDALSERALFLAQDLDDQAAEAKILWNLLNLYRWSERVEQAIEYGERSLSLARRLNLREQMAFTLNDLTHCYSAVGRLDRAEAVVTEARDLWRELDNRPMLADSLSTSCIYYQLAGEYDRALALSDEAFEISQSIDNLWGQVYGRYVVGPIAWERGQPDRAIAVMEEVVEQGEVVSFLWPQVMTRAELAMVYGSLGAIGSGIEMVQLALNITESQLPFIRFHILNMLARLQVWQDDLDEAGATLDQALKHPTWETAPPLYSWTIHLTEGELALKLGDYERAISATNMAMDIFHQIGIRAYIPQTLVVQGQALLALGHKETARDRLLEAHVEAEAMGSRWMLWQILFALSQFETDPAEAELQRQQARKILEAIVEHTPPDLRTSFLDRPDVKALLTTPPD